jgi:hypothetical protein
MMFVTPVGALQGRPAVAAIEVAGRSDCLVVLCTSLHPAINTSRVVNAESDRNHGQAGFCRQWDTDGLVGSWIA